MCDMIKSFKWSDMLKTGVGKRLTRWTVVEKAPIHYLNGTPERASHVSPVTTICRCFRSTNPFCLEVWGHRTRLSKHNVILVKG